ncbi:MULTISPECIES: alpha/beta fold hydrolase [Prauserella salsuginis group]|uniref:Pimeloyl-ACP methyl ester carboxylesterase n=2 Tax=Prauserella salsuginis group TaxID=2893672 RepID=A0A839XJ37_9PSEU|nr:MULTISPECIES: alpha/beta hydrolase [Prauserella salsuginis group]MBB3661574.1 pimeloyl-ACP methyl ester carboxylesterase [Prauserella sediminis]MCR3719490.1 Pimeloyl-ACP methyl ester carboxylesterase [Prauserella flava]MCR3735496.1 Pimeloyl-ACP methyl ester carboxylesterase [Prauserella salsuginis]
MIEHLSIPTSAGDFDAIAAGPHDGRPVLLLHGFPEAAVEWEHQVARLGDEGYRAVAPDQRGYSPGVRPADVADYEMDHLVDDVVAMAGALGWSRFDLVGHDWGGAVAWWTADRHPDRLRSLTAVSTPHPRALGDALRTDEDQAMRSQYMRDWRNSDTEKRMLADGGEPLRRMFEWKVPRGRVDDYLARLSEPGALTAALNWYRAGSPKAAIEAIAVPTLYVWSTEDVAFGSTAALATEQWVSGPYEFQMLEDVTHWVPEEAPEQLTALLLDHLHRH